MKSYSPKQSIMCGMVLVVAFSTMAFSCNPSAIRSVLRVVQSSSAGAVQSGTALVASQAAQSAASEVVAKTTGEILKKLAVNFGKYVSPGLVVGTADVVGDTIRSNKDAKAMEAQLESLKEHQNQVLQQQELAATVRRNHEKELKKMELDIYQAKKPEVTNEELPPDYEETNPLQSIQPKQTLRDQSHKLTSESLLQDGLNYALQKPFSDLNSILLYFCVIVGVSLASTISFLCCCYFAKKFGTKSRADRFGLPITMITTCCTLLFIGLALAVAGSSHNFYDEDATESHVKQLLRAGWIPPWLSPNCIIPGDLELDVSEMGWILFRAESRALHCERQSAESNLKCSSPEITWNNSLPKASVLILAILMGTLFGYYLKTYTNRRTADNSNLQMKNLLDYGALAIVTMLVLSFVMTSQAAVIPEPQSSLLKIYEVLGNKVEFVDEKTPTIEFMEKLKVSELDSVSTNNLASRDWYLWKMVATLSQELLTLNCANIIVCSKVKLLRLLLLGGLSLTITFFLVSLAYLGLRSDSKK